MKNIKIPIIKVNDKYSDGAHIVGTGSHDQLIIDGNAIHYINIQSMTGTQFDGDYRFVGIPGNEYEPETTVEFVSLEKFVEIYSEVIRQQGEDEKKLQELIKRLIAKEKKADKIKNKKSHIFHT